MHRSPSTALRRRHLIQALGAGLLCSPLLSGPAQAQWPKDKVIRIVIPFAAGGATDVLGRALATEMGKILNQSVIVENRAGAGGALGAQTVATAAADGYTLLLASGSMFTVNQFIYNKLPYSMANFAPISKVASGPMVITVNANLPYKSTKEFIAHAKQNPGKISFASAGIGSQTHMAAEAMADSAGINIVHVPYKGDGPANADLMAGVIEMVAANINSVTPLLKSGRVRALSVTGKERSALLPDVPTTAEDGVPGFEFTGWFALMAPSGTPGATVEQLASAVKNAVEQPGLKRYLTEQGMYASLMDAERLKAEIASESQRWKALVEKKKISAN